ncbi:hypothetical protein FRB99_008284 [Tulasnella sp. 403]|nr:hypothetical protein FRB99_008284 [Tulasnella sp. 403]
MCTRRVTLTPKAGFVVKTTNTIPGTYTTRSAATDQPDSTLNPKNGDGTIAVPKGYKIFLNVCWDAHVPPPPERTEAEIRKAMMGADIEDGVYFVPVVVSDGRPVTDKAGKASLVFDCVFNNGLRSRSSKDVDFRTFLTEIALERVEDKSGLTLSREISTPNILSKGSLEPRTVLIPTALPSLTTQSKPLIEEIPDSRREAPPTTGKGPGSDKPSASVPQWSAEVEKNGVTITVEVPKLTKQDIVSRASVDVEAHRIIFRARDVYDLDLRLSPHAKFTSVTGRTDEDSPIVSGGKGMQPDSATAQWKLKEQVLVIRVPWS